MAVNFFKVLKGLFLNPQSGAPSSPTDGDLYYDGSIQKWQFREAGSWKNLGSGASGINYILNPEADTGTTGWATYKDTAGASPVDGTGGTPTHVTLSTTGTTPLRGLNSFLLSNSGSSSAQGEGASYDFTIDRADQSKILEIAFDYTIASGTFQGGSQGSSLTPSDVTMWIYDVTNGVLIQPTPYVLTGNGSGPYRFIAAFQTASNSTSYRLIFHVGTTNTAAWALKFDNVSVGPQLASYGAPISDWQSFTPTGSWTTNVTYAGRWRRVGDSMEVRGTMSFTGTSDNSTLTLNMPAGYAIDTSKLSNTGTQQVLGELAFYNFTGGTVEPGALIFRNSTSFYAYYILNNNGANRSVYYDLITQVTPQTNGNNFVIEYSFKVPILGWGSTVLMSNDTDTRVVAARYFGMNSTVVGSTTTNIKFDSVEYDTHAAYDPSSGTFTVPVSGYYRVGVNIGSSTAITASVGNGYNVAALVNGSGALFDSMVVQTTSAIPVILTGSTLVYCNAGDQITLAVLNSSSSSWTTSGSVNSWVSFQRVSGPSVIAATEKVALMYYSGNGISLTNSPQLVGCVTKVYDTHGAYDPTPGNYSFTAPRAGKYRVKAAMNTHITPNLATDSVIMGMDHPAASLSFQVAIEPNSQSASSFARKVCGDITFECLAGDIITVNMLITNSSTGTTGSGSDDSYICIESVD